MRQTKGWTKTAGGISIGSSGTVLKMRGSDTFKLRAKLLVHVARNRAGDVGNDFAAIFLASPGRDFVGS